MANGWSYTFCDLVSGDEIATLPVEGATFEEKLNGVGAFSGMVPTVDPEVRALDPWAATEPRRTALYIEHDDVVQWGGIVWGRSRDQDTAGLNLTGATFDSFLEFLYLRTDADFVGAQLGPMTTTASLLAQVQAPAGANIGLESYYFGDGTGENRLDGFLYKRTALRSMAEMLENFAADNQVTLEWRTDVTKENGRYVRRLAVYDGELIGPLVLDDDAPTLPPTVYPVSPLELAYPGNLLTWTDAEDGTTSANAAIGSTSGENGEIFAAVDATALGSDELAAGFPLQTTTLSGGSNLSPLNLTYQTGVLLYDRLAQGHEITNVTLRAHVPALDTYRAGYRADLGISHVSFREWPDPVRYEGYRIVKKKITVGGPSSADAVSLDLVPPSHRIPKSTGLVATFREIQARLRELETP